MSDILTDFSTPALVRAVKSNLYGMLRRMDREERAGFPDTPLLTHWHTAIGHPWFNGVVAARPATARDDRIVEDVLAYFRSCGVGVFTWWLDPALSRADWESQLLPRGFGFEDNTPGMAADLSTLAEARPAPPGLEIMPVTDHAALREWTRVFVAGYGIPAAGESSLLDLIASLGLRWPIRNYLGILDGAPVATSTVNFDAGVAGIYNVATLEEARGRGVGSAVTLAPLRDARDAGYRIGTLQSSDLGYTVYSRLGFREVCRMEHFAWTNPSDRGAASSSTGEATP
jgi:GNAT superfamily N-acetyltransferase